MATVTDTCEVCGLEDFILEDGFYYCAECGSKLRNKREIANDDINVDAQTTLRTEVASTSKITSWEQMNYFLHGLTERLVELGAPEELKPTVLQIWCAYLNIAEIAFFHQRQRKRPRLGLRCQKWDLKLMFNRDLSKRPKRKAKESSEISSKRRRKQNQDMLTAEQDALKQSQNSDIESTLSTLSASMLSSSQSVQSALNFQYNSRARKRFLDELHLDEDHIEWHEHEASVDATCHRMPNFGLKYSKIERNNWSYVHRISVLIAILSIGLNQVRSSIQISDVIRWIEEGHLPIHNLRQYLPEEIDPACYSETLAHLGKGQYFNECRMYVSMIAKDLRIVPIHPDLSSMCYRFLRELALPLDLAPYIAKVMAIGPEIKQTTRYRYFPRYEVHAMKYILFVMKLLFSLDGVIENKLDSSTEKLNERMGASRKSMPKLFVWHEWQRYVTMRRIVVEQLHYPTNHSRTQSIVNRPIDRDLFLSFFESRAVSDDDNMTGYQAGLYRTTHTVAQERLFHNLHTIIASVTEKHSNLRKEQSRKHIDFEHCMEPQRTYFAAILNMDDTERQHVYIPEYMLTDHSKRTVAPFVNPMPLKRHLLANENVRLVTKKIKTSIKHIQMVSHKTPFSNVLRYLEANKFAHVLCMDDNDSSSSEDENDESNILDYINSRAKKYHLSHDDIVRNTLCRNTLEEMESDMRAVQFEVIAKDKSLSWMKELKDEVNPFQNNPTVEERLPNEQRCSETVSIALPNYHYWVNNTRVDEISLSNIEQQYFSTFPASFQFLLREAAYVTRSSMMDLYCELNELEKYIFNIYARIK